MTVASRVAHMAVVGVPVGSFLHGPEDPISGWLPAVLSCAEYAWLEREKATKIADMRFAYGPSEKTDALRQAEHHEGDEPPAICL